jgi:hypothetical protein
MKNIHVLQKNIFNQLGVDHYGKTPTQIKIAEFLINKNIYITSDEEIKEGEWVIQINFEKTNTQVIKCQTESQTIIANSKDGSFTKNKIILTTDQDLIADGVQAIDDEFLEWFVKNPSCERVEINKEYLSNTGEWKEVLLPSEWEVDTKFRYKIIIPQEETKQEKLEEAAERLYGLADKYSKNRIGFIAGAKWQSERMYSEEEVEQIFNIGQMIKNYGDYKPYTFKEALEQFKKK